MSVVRFQQAFPTVKEQVRAVLDQLPDDCTFDDVHCQLYVVSKILQRLTALGADAPVVSHEEAERRIDKWLK